VYRDFKDPPLFVSQGGDPKNPAMKIIVGPPGTFPSMCTKTLRVAKLN
jgi:hypothetical protein